MGFRRLRCFVAAAEELRFTHAAGRLHIEQRRCRELSRNWNTT
jgi:DNA-binding transcriptional LysR family regulator